jgi:hypothetical protein
MVYIILTNSDLTVPYHAYISYGERVVHGIREERGP